MSGSVVATSVSEWMPTSPGPGIPSTRSRSWLRLWIFALGITAFASAAEVIPPAPRDHFNDYAGIVAPTAAQALNDELAQFERTTSNQIVVAIYPHMQSDSSIEDYTVRVAQAWGVGQRDKKNGAVLFIFSQDRKLFIQVGYGLEGALPDALCKEIIANEITPRFRSGDFAAGVTNGIHAMLAAARGEYRGTGRTVADGRNSGGSGSGRLWIAFILVVAFSAFRAMFRRNAVYYSRSGRISPWISTGSWGGGSSGGWSSGGGGGSFSGGGGSFGGGGAGGSW